MARSPVLVPDSGPPHSARGCTAGTIGSVPSFTGVMGKYEVGPHGESPWWVFGVIRFVTSLTGVIGKSEAGASWYSSCIIAGTIGSVSSLTIIIAVSGIGSAGPRSDRSLESSILPLQDPLHSLPLPEPECRSCLPGGQDFWPAEPALPELPQSAIVGGHTRNPSVAPPHSPNRTGP